MFGFYDYFHWSSPSNCTLFPGTHTHTHTTKSLQQCIFTINFLLFLISSIFPLSHLLSLFLSTTIAVIIIVLCCGCGFCKVTKPESNWTTCNTHIAVCWCLSHKQNHRTMRLPSNSLPLLFNCTFDTNETFSTPIFDGRI